MKPTYRKNPKISDTQKFAVITLKVKQDGFSFEANKFHAYVCFILKYFSSLERRGSQIVKQI